MVSTYIFFHYTKLFQQTNYFCYLLFSSSHCEHGVVFLLECLLTLCSSLPQEVFLNQHLNTFFWQKLCPVLISVLGTPKVDKNIVTRNSEVEKERGRGSGGLKYAPSFNNFHARTVYR